MKTNLLFAALFGVVITSSGCALTSKGDALAIRYYTPENAKPTLTSSTASTALPANAPQIELGRINSGINLREKIAFRDSTFEQGYYDDKRWTERPEVYVRRELERTLFEEHGFRRSLANQAPALEVEVVSFEEVLGPNGTHNARIQLKIVIHDDRDSLLEKTITAERPVDKNASGFAGVVQAMAQALDAAAEETAADVDRILKAKASSAAAK